MRREKEERGGGWKGEEEKAEERGNGVYPRVLRSRWPMSSMKAAPAVSLLSCGSPVQSLFPLPLCLCLSVSLSLSLVPCYCDNAL